MNLLTFFRSELRARYWRRRALAAESAQREAEQQLNRELWRQINRADLYTSAAIMGTRGMWGIPPRSAPAELDKPKQQPVAAPVDPYRLTGPDLMEFDTFWKPDAEAAGVPLQEAKRQFIEQVVIPRRMPLIDEPFS